MQMDDRLRALARAARAEIEATIDTDAELESLNQRRASAVQSPPVVPSPREPALWVVAVAALVIVAVAASAWLLRADDDTEQSAQPPAPTPTSMPGDPAADDAAANDRADDDDDPVAIDDSGDEGGPDVGTLRIEPTAVRHGETFTIEMDCAYASSPRYSRLEAGFLDPDDPDRQRDFGAPMALNVIQDEPRVFGGEFPVPYWVEPGTHHIVADCAIDSVAIEVLPPERGRWDIWRPLRGPWPAEPLPGEANEEHGTWEVDATEGVPFGVEALCGPGADVEGARFVVWARYAFPIEPGAREDGFVAIEYPVDDYTETDDGILVAAEITLRIDDFPPVGDAPGNIEGGKGITALCAPTSTPFEADAERDITIASPESPAAPIIISLMPVNE